MVSSAGAPTSVLSMSSIFDVVAAMTTGSWNMILAFLNKDIIWLCACPAHGTGGERGCPSPLGSSGNSAAAGQRCNSGKQDS